MPSRKRGHFSLAYIQGEARGQHTLFPSTLEELIPAAHVCRVIEAFVGKLDMEELGFMRAEPAETGRPGYDPRDLLKLYLYGYLHQLRSSRRLEAECQRNVEVMWLLGRLQPDYKSIAEFRRMHSQAVTEAGAELVRLARAVGLVRGETVAVDGSKFRTVSSAASVRERNAVQHYLEQLDRTDAQDELVIDSSACRRPWRG
jgi:transposase